MRRRFLLAALLVSVCGSQGAMAQRSAENAVASADDAFGTSVGTESTGLYGAYNARGFSPAQAGNVRIDGLYFDQQVGLNPRVLAGSTVHVGISTQAYAFPAPTGVADMRLRLPGDKPLLSTVISYGPYYTYGAEFDGQYPVTDKLSVGGGFGITRFDNDASAMNVRLSFGALARFKPTDTAEVSAFWGRDQDCLYGPQPAYFTAGPYQPPRVPLRQFFSQEWEAGHCYETNFGALGRVQLPDDWTVRAGVFRSTDNITESYNDFYTNVTPAGIGNHIIVGLPPQLFGSYSGEVRVSKVVTENTRAHRFDFTARARDVQREFGGSDVHDFGPSLIGYRYFLPAPTFTFGPESSAHTRQLTTGVAYDGLWRDIGELGVGVQKTFYRRDNEQPGVPEATTKASPLLYNAALSIFATPRLAFYASYTRGLEESGTAPFNAANRNEAMPASMTRQVDAGLRYIVTPQLKVVAGVFQVEKPYFNTNAANVFGPLGTVRHRGIELSLAGQVLPNLTVVGGAILLQPRVSGDPVDRGIVGPVPVGPLPRNLLLSLQYQVPWVTGLAFDTQITNASAQMSRNDNSYKAPGYTQLNAGVRYAFKVADVPASVRFQAFNLTDVYSYGVNGSGGFSTRSPRNFKAIIAADF